MIAWFTKQDALNYIYEYPEDSKLCPECFRELSKEGEVYACPNPMCKSTASYNAKGEEVCS